MAAPALAAKTLGTLVVVVIRARNLRDKHTFTKQDPYVTVQLGKEKKSTEIDKRGGQHPVWDVDLHLAVSLSTSKDTRTLKVSCFSKEPKEDDLVGAGEVDITDVLETGEFDDWVTIKEDDAYRGEVYLEMTFFNTSNTKPHSRRKPQMPQSERLHSPTPPISNAAQDSPPRRPHPLPPPQLQPGNGEPRRPPPSNNQLPLNDNGVTASRPPRHDASPPRRNPQAPANLTASKLQAVPSILRPGNAKSSPTPIPSNDPPMPGGQPFHLSFPTPRQDAPLPYPGDNPSTSNNNHPPRSSQTSNTDYAARERASLARASQEEADEELARILSQNDQVGSEGGGVGRASQEQADEELARIMAQNEGIDLDSLRREEADREVARELARELNAEVLSRERTTQAQASRQGGASSGPMPGGW